MYSWLLMFHYQKEILKANLSDFRDSVPVFNPNVPGFIYLFQCLTVILKENKKLAHSQDSLANFH